MPCNFSPKKPGGLPYLLSRIISEVKIVAGGCKTFGSYFAKISEHRTEISFSKIPYGVLFHYHH